MQKVVRVGREIWQKPSVRILTSLSILALVLRSLPLTDLWETLRHVRVASWLLVVSVAVAAHSVGVVKWRLLISMGQSTISLRRAFRCYFAGLFSNIFLPSATGGDIVRAAMALQSEGEQGAVILGSLLDRLSDVSALALLVAMGAWWSPTVSTGEVHRILAAVEFIFLALGAGVMLLLTIPVRQLPRWLRMPIAQGRKSLRRLIRNPWRAIAGFGMSLLIQGIFVVLHAFLGATVGIDIAPSVWLFAFPLAKLAAMLPVSIGGLGVREAALAMLLAQFGVPTAKAVGLGLVWQSIVVACGGLGGVFYLTLGGEPRVEGPLAIPTVAQRDG